MTAQTKRLRNRKVNLFAAWTAQFLCIIGLNAAVPFMPFYIREWRDLTRIDCASRIAYHASRFTQYASPGRTQ